MMDVELNMDVLHEILQWSMREIQNNLRKMFFKKPTKPRMVTVSSRSFERSKLAESPFPRKRLKPSVPKEDRAPSNPTFQLQKSKNGQGSFYQTRYLKYTARFQSLYYNKFNLN